MTGAAKLRPIIIAVAPNGARRTKADHPNLPITAEELARTAASCREAGASMIHLHVRDAQGRHLLDADAYRQTIAAVRQEVAEDMVIQITSEAAGRYAAAHQMATIRAVRPEAVSLALREIVPDPAGERAAGDFFEEMWREKVSMQFILYSRSEWQRYRDLKTRGVIPGGTSLFVLGRYSATQQSSPEDLLPFLCDREDNETWMTCAFGHLENACAMATAALGGHARVGFENNLYCADGRLAPDNAALVAQLARGVGLVGRVPADGATARAILAGAAQ
ncbi:MAG: 3-keto-5-aminohexanoate cleavage protein [Rhodospirillales bacterium]|nr:3-keto-5-aminohexanoate cleavage protein [Rhodospirillales bacterium]